MRQLSLVIMLGNRIKKKQLWFFANHPRRARMSLDQLRFCFSVITYTLIQVVCRMCFNLRISNLTKGHFEKLHSPVIYILCDESDMAHSNRMDDFSKINHLPVFAACLDGVGHGGLVV